jgi:hypothetical protein
MKTIILPGFSINNKEWGIEALKHLDTPVFYEWTHWEGEGKFDITTELKKLLPKARNHKVNILAKSIGTWVTVNLLREKGVSINKIILCGIPLHDLSEGELAEYSSLIEIDPKNILVIQNLEDPHGSFHEVKNFVGKINPDIKLIEKDRSDHNYPYFYSFKEFFKE